MTETSPRYLPVEWTLPAYDLALLLRGWSGRESQRTR